jgi:hypothetical protein
VARGGDAAALLTGEEGARRRGQWRVAFDDADGSGSECLGGVVIESRLGKVARSCVTRGGSGRHGHCVEGDTRQVDPRGSGCREYVRRAPCQ